MAHADARDSARRRLGGWVRRAGRSRSARIVIGLVAVLVYSSSGAPLPSYAATPVPAEVVVAPVVGERLGGALVPLSAGGPVSESATEPAQAVLFVHGWLSTSLPGAADDQPGIAQSPFAHPAAAVQATAVDEVTHSLQQSLESLPGTTLYAFDYSQTAAAWIGGSAVVDGLAASIRQLALETGAPVDVVAHSMGGLALRHAVAAHPDLIPMIGQVITVGTPTQGSDAATLLDIVSVATGTVIGAGSAGRALIVPALVDLCNRDLEADAMNGCGLPTWLRTSIANTGEAGRALHAGSAELANMPDWPAELDVHAIAGDGRLRAGGLVVSVGDGLVSRESATAEADTVFVVRCEDRVAPGVTGVGELLGGNATLSFGGAGCAHDELLRNPDVVENVRAVIAGLAPSPANPRLP
ncbi:hypothetical protein [Microbacterium sp. zg.Y909]|uniref:hypothetical protein n=1 Tax=Microbacterium sp. zg.Y909 TaxID=2969413 RepID=UPI00214CF36D|nr:hypothetical protein [Microbacterium sp. zg.Y909]MCR2824273.1 hypothetical protein [Microbacterium sp. zg.Y909]